MYGTRELLAALLGVGFGVVLIAYPTVFLRLQTVGRIPDDHRGPYGESGDPPTRWKRLVQLGGVVSLAVGLYIVVHPLVV